MLRLCSESSRPYPGRSVRLAVGQATGAGLRPRLKGLELPPDPTALPTALMEAIPEVIGQKSAEAIVAKCPG
jgi:hypothetical protein